MDHSLSIHLKGHLSCLQVLTICNKAAINICVQILCVFSSPLRKHKGEQLLERMVKIYVVLEEIAKGAAPFCIPTSCDESSYCLTSLPAFGIASVDFHRSHMHVCIHVCSDLSNFVTMQGSSDLPGSSVHGILQARILEWFAMPSSKGSFQSRDQTPIS